MRSARILLLATAILGAAAGGLTYRATQHDRSLNEAAAELMRVQLPDASGKNQRLAQWRDRVLVINFWATWCEPCREEIPVLIRVQAKYALNDVQIVGISVDSAAKVRKFASEYRIAYPLLIGGLDAIDLTRRLGNNAGGLPFTVVLDRGGKVVKTRLGAISEAELEIALQAVAG